MRTPNIKKIPEPEIELTRCDGCDMSCAMIYTRRADKFFPLHCPVKGRPNYFLDTPFETQEQAIQESIEPAQECRRNKNMKKADKPQIVKQIANFTNLNVL